MLGINLQRGRYTFSNMRSRPTHIVARLDRFMIHSNFININYSIKLYIFPSLHIHEILEYGPFPFHFNHLCVNHPEVFSLVESTWKTWVPVTPIFIWEQKLIMVKQTLKI